MLSIEKALPVHPVPWDIGPRILVDAVKAVVAERLCYGFSLRFLAEKVLEELLRF